MTASGVEVELIVSVIEACLLLPTMLCVFRFPLRSDSFSRFSLWLMLAPEFLQLSTRVALNVSNNFGPSTLAILMIFRLCASICVMVSTLLLVVCSFHHLQALDYKGSKIFKLLSLGVLGLNVSLLGVSLFFTYKSDIRFIIFASMFTFGENLLLALGIIFILFRLHMNQSNFAERRRGPDAKVLFKQTLAYSEWELIVYFLTFEYFVFDPAYTAAEFMEPSINARPPTFWTPYPYGTFWAFLRLLRPTFSAAGVWLWHAAFRYDLRRVLRQKGHKATNTITISENFSGRNEPAPVGGAARESSSNNRLASSTNQTPRRLNIPHLVKGPFAQIERQQQRLGTSYMHRR